LLRPFEITHDSVRIGDETLKGYMRSDFEDAFGRYLPATPATRNDPNDLTENSERYKEGVTSDDQYHNHSKINDVADVADARSAVSMGQQNIVEDL
jgi:hypothetical protein